MVDMDTTLPAHRPAPLRRDLLARQILGDEPGDLLLAGGQLGRRDLFPRSRSLGELGREQQRAAALARLVAPPARRRP